MNLSTPRYTGPSWAQPLPDFMGKGRVRPLVLCVYWGNKYSIDYVWRLRAGVAANLSMPHDFACVSSDPRIDDICERIEPAVAFEGWWQKIGLFDESLAALLGGVRPVFYLDIDVAVTGQLDPMLQLEVPQHGLIMAENFGPNKPHCAHNSSAMVWINGSCADIAKNFRPEYMQQLHGDQCFIWRCKHGRIDNFPPGLVRSYKYECAAHLPADTRVVVFHGKPDPHEVQRHPWVKQHWGTLTQLPHPRTP